MYGKPCERDWMAKFVYLIQMLPTFGGSCNRYFWDIRLKLLRFPNFNMLFQPVQEIFQKWTVFVFTESWSRDQDMQKSLLLVFSVTPLKIAQNKTQTRSTDTVQNLGNERSYIYKDPRQDSGQKSISYTRYQISQTHRDLYGDAMLVHTGMSSFMADGNQQKHLLPRFATKARIYSSRNS